MQQKPSSRLFSLGHFSILSSFLFFNLSLICVRNLFPQPLTSVSGILPSDVNLYDPLLLYGLHSASSALLSMNLS